MTFASRLLAITRLLIAGLLIRQACPPFYGQRFNIDKSYSTTAQGK